MATAEPLASLINTIQLTDVEIRHVSRNAAAEAERIVRSLEGSTGVGARVRSAQVSLAKLQVEYWGDVNDAVRVGIGDAFDASTEMQALFDRRLTTAAGISPQYWKQSMLAQSRAGIDAFIAREEFNYKLSDRVYRNRALSQGTVKRTIDNGLLLGKGPYEIAKDVKRFIDPATPGGASYAAMRLGRSEVNNAFHTNSVKGYQNTPWVARVKWNMSSSHGKADECNEYAEDLHWPTWGPGEYPPMDVPPKPHPNCLCYTTPVADDLETYVKNFHEGKYDDYINEQLGCSRVA
jgi:hypothetical protein